MHLFVALPIEAEIRTRIEAFAGKLKPRAPGVRFVSAESYHITLKFLGETEKLDAICAKLQTISAAQFPISIRGAGFFPDASRPRVFWAGIETGPELAQLAAAVNAALAPLGFAAEPGPFHPHLTLARNGSGSPRSRRAAANSGGFQQLQQALASMLAPEFGTMRAREFVLYESRLSPSGAAYSRLERFALG